MLPFFRHTITFALMLSFSSVFAAEPIAADKVKPRVKASPETTRVTGPLDAEGYVDFIAAANAQASQGVTRENNAYVLILQVLGPAENRLDIMHKLCDELGVARIPEQGDYIIGYRALGSSTNDASGKQTNPLWTQFDQAQERPWTTEEFPEIAKLMARNEQPLALVAKAVERPKYYRPMVRMQPDDAMFELLLPDVQTMREIARVLRARAMWHLGHNRMDDAERDLLVLHRLASHIGHGQFLIERLVGVACEAIACAGDRQLVLHPGFSAPRAAAYRERLLTLPATPQMVECIEVGERFGAMDIIQCLSRGRSFEDVSQILYGSSPQNSADGVVPTVNWSRFAQAVMVLSVDWNVMLVEMNRLYDELVAAAKQPDHMERVAATKRLEQRLGEMKNNFASTTGVLQTVFASNRQRGKTMSNVLGSLLLPAVGNVMVAQERGATNRELVILGTALREYREVNGRYPESLDQLASLLPAIPQDRFTNQPLKYRATESTYLLYSVGANGKDDHGRLGTPAGTDDPAISDPPPAE